MQDEEQQVPAQEIVEGANDGEIEEAEDQKGEGQQEDMRANDPACLLCDDGGELLKGTFMGRKSSSKGASSYTRCFALRMSIVIAFL